MTDPFGTALASHPVPDDALARHLAVLGTTGMGKTYLGKTMVERLLGRGRRVCIIDPTGVWWGLRSNAEGDGPGFPVVVFGGDHADVPIDGTSGRALAELVASGEVPASIIDVGDFETESAKHAFVTEFASTLYRLNRAPLHLVIDEADDVAPQNPFPESKRMLGAIVRIVKRGRVKGFRVMLITQRPASLNKNVLTQASTLVALGLPAPQDRKAVEAWIKGQADVDQGKAVLDSLAGLDVGEGWVWAPQLGVLDRATFPRITTYDSSRSPEDDDAPLGPAPTLAPVDLTAIRARLAPPEAEEEEPARRGRAGRAAAPPAPAPDPASLDRAWDEGHQTGLAEGRANCLHANRRELEWIAALCRQAIAGVGRVMAALPAGEAATADTGATLTDGGVPPSAEDDELTPGQREKLTELVAAENAPDRRRVIVDAIDLPGLTTADQARKGTASDLPAPTLRILDVLARQHPLRLTQAQWATLAGMAHRGGAWQAHRSKLLQAELVDRGADDRHGCTARGLELSGLAGPAPASREQTIAMWRSKVGPAGKLIDVLVATHPRWIARETLAERVGMTAAGGAFQAHVSKLARNGLAETRRGRRELRAAPILFGEPSHG